MPTLKTTSQKTDSILIGTNTGGSLLGPDSDEITGGKWEDEEERRFYEDIVDLKDYVPKSLLGISGESEEEDDAKDAERKEKEKEKVQEDIRKLEEELAELKVDETGRVNGDAKVVANGAGPVTNGTVDEDEDDE